MTTIQYDDSKSENLEIKVPDSEKFVVNLKICHSCPHFQKSETNYCDAGAYKEITTVFSNSVFSLNHPLTNDKRYKCTKPKYQHIQLGRKLDGKLVFIEYLPEGCDFLLEQMVDCDTIHFGKHETELTVEGILAKSQEILDKEEDNGSKV